MSDQNKIRIGIIGGMVALFLLSDLYFFLVKIGCPIFLITGLAQLTLFVTVSFLTVKLIWRLVKRRDWRNLVNYLALLVVPLVLVLSGFESLTADENTLQSPVKIKACYEGTMNTSRLFLRDNNEFEEFNVGFFAYVSYISGKWKVSGDTILLTFKPNFKHKILSDRLVIRSETIYKVKAGTLEEIPYYLGECKGLN